MKPPLRTKSVGTKVSEAEFALLEERARGAGMRLAEWVREALLSAPAESQQPGAGGSFASSDTSGSLSTGSESLSYRYGVLQNGWSSGYSPNGNVVGYTDSVMGNWSFGYDNGSRLTSATASPAVEGSTSYLWTYDSFGNRLTQTGNGGSNVWAQYANDSGGNPHNQVTQTNARGRAYFWQEPALAS